MNEAVFSFGAVPGRYSDIVQRSAVLYMLQKHANTPDEVRELTSHLVDRWRARVAALVKEGWQPGTGGEARHNLMYVRNCRPTFVMNKPATRACRHDWICPFCYARWVRDVWLLMDSSFQKAEPIHAAQGGQQLRGIECDEPTDESETQYSTVFTHKIVSRRHRMTVPIVPPENDMSAADYLKTALRAIVDKRKDVVRLVDPVGAFMFSTIVPDEAGRNWEIIHRQIFKLQQSQSLPECLTGANSNLGIVEESRPTRKKIHDIVVDVCAYPPQLMVGDPYLVERLLAIRQSINFKASAKFRSFRRGFDV